MFSFEIYIIKLVFVFHCDEIGKTHAAYSHLCKVNIIITVFYKL